MMPLKVIFDPLLFLSFFPLGTNRNRPKAILMSRCVLHPNKLSRCALKGRVVVHAGTRVKPR